MSEIGSFRLGSPNLDLVPLEPLVKATNKLLEDRQSSSLSYGEVQGDPCLRQEILARFASYYSNCSPEQTVLTYGATEAISLVARALLKPGDVVVVESPTYYWALPEFVAQGAHIIQVPIDEHGMKLEFLESALEHARRTGLRVRLIYSMPTFHNPTGATLSLVRRQHLLEIARRHNAVILEDDAYFLLRYEDCDIPPLVTLDNHGVVIHASTLSKVIAPGIRVGWILTRSTELIRSILTLKPNGTNPFVAAAVLNFLRSGFFDLHLNRILEFYRKSWDICSAGMEKLRKLDVQSSRPCGGFYYWLRLPRHWSAEGFTAFCAERGIEVICGDKFFAHTPPEPSVRLAFSSFDHTGLRQELRKLSVLAKQYRQFTERGKTEIRGRE